MSYTLSHITNIIIFDVVRPYSHGILIFFFFCYYCAPVFKIPFHENLSSWLVAQVPCRAYDDILQRLYTNIIDSEIIVKHFLTMNYIYLVKKRVFSL